MKVLVDCNVLIDVATDRQPFAADSGKVLDWCEAHPGSAFVAWHSLATFYYLTQKGGNGARARSFLQDLLTFVEVVPAGTIEAKHALTLPMTDFEDALQCTAAIHAGVDVIITRNVQDYTQAPVQALKPSEFMSQAPA